MDHLLRTMVLQLRKASERGRADHGWLDTHHTFSFADYHDPEHMGFRSLRVINEDFIAPGKGFGTHPHRDMEIFSYVLEGELEHQDSLGNGRVLRPGEIQLMSAGRGVAHSEFNPNRAEPTHMLQVWILPQERALTPSYTEWKPDARREHDAKVLVISPDGRDDSARIHQDAFVYRVRLARGAEVQHELAIGRGAWVQVARGAVDLNGTLLKAGDGAAIEDVERLNIVARDDAEALLFDLA